MELQVASGNSSSRDQLPSHQPGYSFAPPSPGHSNLYVKSLPTDFDDATLHAVFSPYGTIDSCRVVRSAKTHASKGYGFVKYATVEQAQNAIAAVNAGAAGAGLHMEVKFADADAGPPLSSTGQVPSDNLYVRNLPPIWGEADLAALFATYGNVQECRVLHAGDQTRGSGALVRMAAVSEAAASIEALNNQMLPGAQQPLLVRFADSAEEKARKMALKERGSPSARFPMHDPAGRLYGAAQMMMPPHMDNNGGGLRGPGKLSSLPAGFSAFSSSGIPDTPSIAQQALQQQFADAFQPGPGLAYMGEEEDYPGAASTAYLGALPYAGSPGIPGVYAADASPPYNQGFAPVFPSSAGPPGVYGRGAMPMPPMAAPAGGLSGSLYIKNLPPEADKLYLYERFAAHGAIQSVKVLVDEQTGQCRGVGFVNYSDAAAALQAISALHGVKAGDKLLYVSLQTHRGRGTGAASGAGGQ